MLLWFSKIGFRNSRASSSVRIAAFVLTGAWLTHQAIPARSISRDETITAKHNAIETVVTHVTDLSATLHVTTCEPKEMEKIGKDFARTYALRTLTLLYKQPGHLRLDGKSSTLGDATLILNGAQRFYAVPRFHLKKNEDLKDSPPKRQSLLEYGGLVAPETLSFMQAKYIKSEPLGNQETQVYDLFYRGVAACSHYRVWIDPKTHITVKRAWYDSEKRLKATFFYLEPREVQDGFWIASRMEVNNADGVLAAVTKLDDVQINQGLSDDLFSTGQ